MSGADVVPFQFEAQEVRAIERDGDPWFILVDVCRVLGIGNPSDAAGRLDEDEKAALDIVDISSKGVAQQRSVTIVNESGLYSLILTSRKPEARRFKKWVTSEVLPSIRKTGKFEIDRPKTTGEMLVENAKTFRELEIREMEQARRLDSHEAKLLALGAHEDYRSIKAHAALIGRKLRGNEASDFGRIATALSRQRGAKIGSQPDETYGSVNTYHRDILDEVFGKGD
jgi:prophage antirepressor-like protein